VLPPPTAPRITKVQGSVNGGTADSSAGTFESYQLGFFHMPPPVAFDEAKGLDSREISGFGGSVDV